jgi:hypothetical protein
MPVRRAARSPIPIPQVAISPPVMDSGSHLIREFARHFVSVRAEANGSPVMIVKEAGDLGARRHARERSPWWRMPCAFDQWFARTPTPAAAISTVRRFSRPEGRAEAPCEVEIVAPEGAAFRNWRCDHYCPPRAPRCGASAPIARRTTTS